MRDYKIYTASEKLFENQLFYQMGNEKLAFKYNANSFVFKVMPTITEIAEALPLINQKRIGECITLRFPIDESLPKTLESYLQGQGFSIEKINLYQIFTNNFPFKFALAVDVKKVTLSNYQDFAKLAFIADSKYGEDYAKANAQWNRECFCKDKKFSYYLAYKNNVPVGSLKIIHHKTTLLELDNFSVLGDYQNQGIGVTLQSTVMKSFPNKELFLVADGFDTPKDMYEQQGYQLQFFWFEAQKIL